MQNSSREKGRELGCVLQRTDVTERTLSDSIGLSMGAGNVQTNGVGHNLQAEEVERSFEHSARENPSNSTKKAPPPNGKKTKGRVKIKMEFIDNKLRRYTTFSKRKTGIMKKAYELSTLTGTQVMLLVASETGHVYTFATRKLQPMITSEAGKALIQTCLNSPDPPLGPGGSGLDQRMSATGFEEPDLTYSVGDDCDTKMLEGPKSLFPVNTSISEVPTTQIIAVSHSTGSITPSTPITSLPLLTPSLSSLTSAATATTSSSKSSSPTSVPTISMHLPQGAGYATIITPGTLSPALQIGTFHTQDQNSNSQQGTTQNQTQTLYRLSQAPFVSIPGPTKTHSTTSDSSTSSQNSISVVHGSQQNVSVVSGNLAQIIPANSTVLPTTSSNVTGAVMYQTAQGLVYATPTTLPEGVILNLGQEHGGTAQQFITIPVPVSLTPAQQQQLIQTQGAALSQVTSANLPSFSGTMSTKRDKSRK